MKKFLLTLAPSKKKVSCLKEWPFWGERERERKRERKKGSKQEQQDWYEPRHDKVSHSHFSLCLCVISSLTKLYKDLSRDVCE